VSLLWTAIAQFAATYQLSFEEVFKFKEPVSLPNPKPLESIERQLALDDIPRMTSQQQASGS